MKLIGRIDRIIFEQDGFLIALLDSGEKISGHYHETDVAALEDSAVTLEGDYVDHPRHGRSFAFHTLNVNQNELFFFLNRVVKGFPRKVTAELIDTFGEEGLVDILDHDIERLREFAGIKAKRLERIQARWRQFRGMRELGGFLAPFGVSPVMIGLIFGAMKSVENPVETIRNNPYVLGGISGIGFRRTDTIALKMGMAEDAPERIGAAMDFAIRTRCEREGNSCLEKAALFSALDELLQSSAVRPQYEAILQERVAEGSICPINETLLAPGRLYEAEKFIYDELTRRACMRDTPIVKDPDTVWQQTDLTLGDEQREAVLKINSGLKLLCLVGYAGTGKSTTSRTLLQLLSMRYDRKMIMTCALSGIASQRIAETTGFDSATIQSLLVRFEEKDEMPYSVLLIDEASMINSTLFARLLAKCGRDAVIVLVGDDAQLPPIGAGNLLGDIIVQALCPVVKLTRIYRQSEEQAIAVIANEVRQGRVPDFLNTYEDFRFQAIGPSSNREAYDGAVLAALVQEAVACIPVARTFLGARELGRYLRAFQVISPMKKGTLGVDNLNRVLQAYFNPPGKSEAVRGEQVFRLMDKVVHTKNENMPAWSTDGFKAKEAQEQRRIMNGMCGLLFRIDEAEEQAYVVYPNEALVVRYEYAQLTSHLMLAYALTVHKVQGMEYDTVVMPMSFSHAVMLNAKLLYTAITRAKTACRLIGEPQAFIRAAERTETVRRRTVLQMLAQKKGLQG